MAKREGVALLLGGMSPAELVAKRKAKMGAPAPEAKPAPEEPDADDSAEDRTAALSALHEFADACGFTVKDEDKALQAFSDLMESCPKNSYDESE